MGKYIKELTPDMNILHATKKVLSSRLEPTFLLIPHTTTFRDPEDVHDVRVNIRRLQAAIDVLHNFVPAKILKNYYPRLKKMFKTLSPLRDYDVQMQLFNQWKEIIVKDTNISDTPGIDTVIESIRQKRSQAQNKAEKLLTGEDRKGFFRDFFLEIGTINEDEENAENLIDVLNNGIRQNLTICFKKIKKIHSIKDEEEIHDIRKAFKLLRYSLEIAKPCFKKEFSDFISALKKMQDFLGDFQDIVVGKEILSGYPATDDIFLLKAFLDNKQTDLFYHFMIGTYDWLGHDWMSQLTEFIDNPENLDNLENICDAE